MIRRLILGLVTLGLLAATAGSAVQEYFHRIRTPFQGYDAAEQFVEIPPGTPVMSIASRLADAGVVRDTRTFRLALRAVSPAPTLKAGEYRFDRPLSAVEVVDKLARGDVFLQAVTIPEGLTIDEMSHLFESAGFGPASEFVRAAADAASIRALDPRAPDLEGYLFPDTYHVPRRTRAEDLTRVMVRQFERIFTEDLRREAAARGLSVREVVTLASLIEKETAKPEERFLTSAVYHNRLRIGMGLQCDPTLIYALRREGMFDGNLRRDHLKFDSPYNTYRYRGLPPGPIAAPGLASLQAAIRPAAVDYLYFVSRNDGTHVFARTLAEHNVNVREHQVRFFREKRRRERSVEAELRRSPPR
jgi:UPF0755 protein